MVITTYRWWGRSMIMPRMREHHPPPPTRVGMGMMITTSQPPTHPLPSAPRHVLARKIAFHAHFVHLGQKTCTKKKASPFKRRTGKHKNPPPALPTPT